MRRLLSLAVVSICISLAWAGVRSAFTADPVNPLAAQLQDSSCQIWDDAQGIPHVRAENDETALACLGLVHARDRIWEMDYFRHAVQGRRAELLGSDQIKSDFMMRLLGLHERARLVFSGMTPEQQRPLWAYSYGVNRGMELALEKGNYAFQHLGYRPEPWHPEDSIALVLLQSFDQTRKTFGTAILEEKWKAAHGASSAPLFSSDGLPWDRAVLNPGEYVKRSEKSGAVAQGGESNFSGLFSGRELSELDAFVKDIRLEAGMGSNNWVVGPSRSTSGKAWLANDPHLRLHTPPVWHLAHFEGGRFDTIGAAFAGIPAIVSGANRKIAWGLTNAYLNVSSIALVPASDLKSARSRIPLIWFKFWKLKIPFFFKSFQVTEKGHPVLPLPAPEGKALVLAWAGLELDGPSIGTSIAALLDLMAAGSAQQADAALKRVEVPTWNFVFADNSGKIGLRSVGKIPKAEAAPDFGVPERRLADWEAALDRRARYTADEMPHVMNPARGVVVTANNRQWPEDARFHGGRAYQQGFRAFRIEELLAASKKHSFESLRTIQCDVSATDARFMVPELVEHLPKGESDVRKAREELTRWAERNYEADLGCRACGLYRRWMDHLKEDYVLNDSAIFRKARSGSPEDSKMFLTALRRAQSDLGSSEPEWGKIHGCRFPHLLGDQWFGAESLPTPGDDHTVAPGTSDWRNGRFDQDSGASQRLIVELSDPPSVWSALPGENQDRAERALLSESGPWSAWARCELQRRAFPVDWEAHPGERVILRSGAASLR